MFRQSFPGEQGDFSFLLNSRRGMRIVSVISDANRQTPTLSQIEWLQKPGSYQIWQWVSEIVEVKNMKSRNLTRETMSRPPQNL